MSNPDFDKKVWEFIENFYKESCGEIEKKRKENQLEAYWCRPAGDGQKLFTVPEQRVFARFLRSYLNTTWHKVQLTCKKADKENDRVLITDSWFEERNPDIIQIAGRAIENDPFFKKESEKDKKNKENEEDTFVTFCKKILDFRKNLELKDYSFEQEQKENFDKFQEQISEFFKNKVMQKNQKVSIYEEIIYENTCEPYRTIMKMQKIFPGFGIALSCDFLKESHLCNIAKPDIHLCHVFSLIDGIPYSMDLALVKRVAEFAANVCPADKNNFCGSGAYNVDKIIWQICSDYDVDNDKTKKLFKKEFLDKIAENNIIKTERMIDL